MARHARFKSKASFPYTVCRWLRLRIPPNSAAFPLLPTLRVALDDPKECKCPKHTPGRLNRRDEIELIHPRRPCPSCGSTFPAFRLHLKSKGYSAETIRVYLICLRVLDAAAAAEGLDLCQLSERRVATLTPIDLRMDPPVSDSRRVVDQLVEVLREEIRALSDALTETEV